MKLLSSSIICSFLLLCSCEPNHLSQEEISSNEKEIVSLLDTYHQSMKTKNADEMSVLFTKDGLFCGTDATELWDYDTQTSYIKAAFERPSLEINDYPIDQRIIRIQPDGKTAISLEQFTMDVISPSIPIRSIMHFVKEDESWKIDFFSYNMIPHNQDLKAINQALQTDSIIDKTTKK